MGYKTLVLSTTTYEFVQVAVEEESRVQNLPVSSFVVSREYLLHFFWQNLLSSLKGGLWPSSRAANRLDGGS